MTTVTLSSVLSSTPIADEYHFVNTTMARYARKVRSFDATLYDPRVVERSREMWLSRMESEHRSTSVFAALCNQLMEAGASWDMESGKAARSLERTIAPVARHRDSSRMECALRNVIYGCCLSETVNCARFVDAIDTMSDPLAIDVTKQLLSDEALHAQFGFHYLDEWSVWLAANPDVRASISRYLRYAFAVLEKDMAGRDLTPRALGADERALGLTDPERVQEIFYTTVPGAIVPALERYGFDAEQSWVERSL